MLNVNIGQLICRVLKMFSRFTLNAGRLCTSTLRHCGTKVLLGQSCLYSSGRFKSYSKNNCQIPWQALFGLSGFVIANSLAKEKEEETAKEVRAVPVLQVEPKGSSDGTKSSAGVSLGPEDDVIMSIKRAKLAEMKKDLKLAEDHYHNALALLAIYQKNKVWDDARIVQARVYVYDHMANLSVATGRLTDAETLFKETLKGLIQTGHKQDDPAVVEISLKLAMIYAAQSKDDHAVQGYTFCIETLEKQLKDADPSSQDKEESENLKALLGMSVDAYSRFLISRSLYVEASECLERAVGIARSVFGEKHPQVAVLLNDLATVMSLRQDHIKARDLLIQAVQIGTATDSADLPVFQCNLASLHATLQDFDSAKKEYSRAVESAKKYKDDATEKKARDALKALKTNQKNIR